MSETLSLFAELDTPKAKLKAAISADVEAAGGCKAIAPDVFPGLSVERAIQRLSNATNPKQKQELDRDEMWTVCRMARRAVGKSNIFEWYANELDCELHWVTAEEQFERDERRLQSLLEHVASELADMKTRRTNQGSKR